MALLTEAGHADTELELISLDDDFNRNTCDAVAAQMRDAGMKVKRTVLPGNTFWNNWLGYPFSATEWNMRPLGVQVYSLAYRTGVAWNETGFSNPEFDDLLTQAYAIPDADKRRELMAKMEKIIQDSGILVQPYWRSTFRHMTAGRARPRHAPDLRDPPGEDLARRGLSALLRHPVRRRAGPAQPRRPRCSPSSPDASA